jgi:taurine dioxygenase
MTVTEKLRITPLSPALGAEIHGLDLSGDLDRATVDAIMDAWHRHIVLLFRDQDLDEAAQVAFAARLGEVAARGRPASRRNEDPNLDTTFTLVSNIRDQTGRPIGSLPDGEMWFHHDTCYTEVPHKGSFLYAIEVPDDGGNTMFANMYKAYDGLPADLKHRLEGRSALQVYDYDRPLAQRIDVSGGLDGIRHFYHPAVISHPATGRKALYVNRLMTARIEGLAEAESESLLAALFDHAERPDIVYRHRWRPGDLIVWDNLCSTHARTHFDPAQRRLLRRCVIRGVRPRA